MLVNIQLLRCIAAMLVVIYHTAAHLPPGSEGAHGLFWFGHAVGYAGVDIFFVISGFIMAWTTLNEGGREASADFIKRRLGRIFSGYWPFFFLALGVFWFARPAHVAESNLLASFFLWPQRLNRVLLEITWTLSYELYFYLLFALLILLVPRRVRPGLCLALTAAIGLASLYRHCLLPGQEKRWTCPALAPARGAAVRGWQPGEPVRIRGKPGAGLFRRAQGDAVRHRIRTHRHRTGSPGKAGSRCPAQLQHPDGRRLVCGLP
ncbi:MAG: acyltransferase family protein [Xanthomonadales bacterium]|nr:acyltransferase [Xanthomonadales bacterium]NIX13688.1 acyltransferase family protein [Xanthomonadales bacterium]